MEHSLLFLCWFTDFANHGRMYALVHIHQICHERALRRIHVDGLYDFVGLEVKNDIYAVIGRRLHHQMHVVFLKVWHDSCDLGDLSNLVNLKRILL